MDVMTATPRPPVVTVACAYVGFSAFLLLFQLIQLLSNWGTIEMQDALEPALTELDQQGVTFTMGELLGTLRWVGLFGVLVLVAGVVFAIYAARGDQASRIGLTVLAVITGMLMVPLGWLGLLQAFFLFFAATTLWSPDARRWYAARQGKTAATDIDAPTPAPPPAPAAQASVQESWPAPVQAGPKAPTQRPRAVLAAGLVTVIGSSLVGGLAAVYLLVYGLAGDEYVRVVQDSPFADTFSADEIQDRMQAAFWGCLVALPLAITGLGAGLSLLARLRVGRVATLALSWITAAVGIVTLPPGLLATGAAVAVIVLLNRDEARAWTQ